MKTNFLFGAVWFAFIVLAGCGGRLASPASASTCDPKDRAIIEREWLTKKGELHRHNTNVLNQGFGDWAHTCSSIEKIELIETTDKGRIYKVVWTGEIFRGYEVASSVLRAFGGGTAGMFTSKMYVKDGHIDSIVVEYSDKTSAHTPMQSLKSPEVAETKNGPHPVTAMDFMAGVAGPRNANGSFPPVFPPAGNPQNSTKGHGRIVVGDGRVIEMDKGNLTPPKDFDAVFYLREYPDVAAHPYFSKHPYEHYVYCGKTEHRKTHADPKTAQATPSGVTGPAPPTAGPADTPPLKAAELVLRYDWRGDQLGDWKWVGGRKPSFENSGLRFHSAGDLVLQRTDIRVHDITMAVATLDPTQAVDVLVGENLFRLHFLNEFMEIAPGSPKVPVALKGGWRTLNISIPDSGNAIMSVGGKQAAAPLRKPGAVSIRLEQSRPLLLGPVVVNGSKLASNPETAADARPSGVRLPK